MPRHITEYSLYRWRYAISYCLVGLLVAALLAVAILYVPGGLSKAEMASVVNSNHLSVKSFDPLTVVDLPYALLQRISFAVLGVTTLSIKLPSLLLGLASVMGIILLLRQWFHENVAVIASLITVTTSQFLFTAQDGTPSIMYIFLPTWLLFLALKISREIHQRNFWEFLFMGIIALSLYTPLSIYVIAALLSATLLHPHLRFIVGRLSRQKVIIAGLIGLVLLGPLIASLIIKPTIGLTLLGIPSDMPDFQANGLTLARAYFSFLSPGTGSLLQPIYLLPSLLLMLLGLSRLFTTKYTARSYSIIIWSVLLIPIMLVNPDKTTITFVPVMLLIAAGIDTLLYRWYRMFPRNPYARVAGLLPMTLLVVGMALTGIERYFYTYRYSPAVAANFSDDLQLLDRELARDAANKKTTMVLISSAELEFYQTVAKFKKDIIVITPDQAVPKERPLILTREERMRRHLGEPTQIITSQKASESDRWYLYKTTP